MDQSSTQTIATFTGTLLQRERHPAKQLVQLVFREDGQNWLCLSTNLANARLDIGKSYRIQGIFKKMGERSIIHEPSISLVRQRKVALVIGLSIGALILLAGATAAALTVMSNHDLTPESVVVKPSAKVTPTSQTDQNPTAATQTSTTAPAADTSPVTPSNTFKKKTANPTVITPIVSPPVTQPVVSVETSPTTESTATEPEGDSTTPDPATDPAAADATNQPGFIL